MSLLAQCGLLRHTNNATTKHMHTEGFQKNNCTDRSDLMTKDKDVTTQGSKAIVMYSDTNYSMESYPHDVNCASWLLTMQALSRNHGNIS